MMGVSPATKMNEAHTTSTSILATGIEARHERAPSDAGQARPTSERGELLLQSLVVPPPKDLGWSSGLSAVSKLMRCFSWFVACLLTE